MDRIEDQVLALMRERYRRVSAERLVSGPGLANWYEGLGRSEASAAVFYDDSGLWAAALSGVDKLAVAALERMCLSLGSFAGDIALAHGAAAVVLAGGVGQRLAKHLPRTGFSQRFVAKGRFEHRLAALPIKVITHPQPGLLGAAAAFAQQHCA